MTETVQLNTTVDIPMVYGDQSWVPHIAKQFHSGVKMSTRVEGLVVQQIEVTRVYTSQLQNVPQIQIVETTFLSLQKTVFP